jgi:UDP-2,3-diacylglucosamine pyrophosphatase LpxH
MAKLWISDTHIGNPSNNLEGIFAIIERKEWEEIYLVGDIFDLDALNNYGEMTDNDEKFFQWIIEMSLRGQKITWFPGNHDRAMQVLMEQLLPGVPFEDERIEKKVWTVHGDRYDLVYQTFKRFTSWGGGSAGMNFWYNLYTRLGMWRTRMAKQAMLRGCKTVICGHMHLPEDRIINGVRYINTGDWMGSSTWLEEEDGVFTLYQLQGELIVPWSI